MKRSQKTQPRNTRKSTSKTTSEARRSFNLTFIDWVLMLLPLLGFDEEIADMLSFLVKSVQLFRRLKKY